MFSCYKIRFLNKCGVYSDLDVYFLYCSLVQDTMAGANSDVYKFDSIVS